MVIGNSNVKVKLLSDQIIQIVKKLSLFCVQGWGEIT